MTKTPSTLPPTSYNLIGGDWRGLSRLSQALYDFDSRSGTIATDLEDAVANLAGKWSGPASTSFKKSFGSDVDDARWLSGVATTIGGIIDQLAVRLATIEAKFEAQLQKGVSAGLITLDRNGGMIIRPGKQADSVGFTHQIQEALRLSRRAAEAARNEAASKLDQQYKALITGMQRYTAPMGNNPGGLLTPEQQAEIKSDVGRLQKEYEKLHPPAKPDSTSPVAWWTSVGWGTGLVVGGALGLVGGPFAEVTVPGGAAAGAAVGSGLGGAIGAFTGWKP